VLKNWPVEIQASLDDGVLEKFGVGLFETEETGAETLLKSTCLDKSKTRVATVAPLAAFGKAPQGVIFTADPEQVVWLLYCPARTRSHCTVYSSEERPTSSGSPPLAFPPWAGRVMR
jgi:hypothetical protein